jgi:polyphosphate kinase
MPRNLDRRVEAVTPIDTPELKQQLEQLLDLYLAGQAGTWTMSNDGSYSRKTLGQGSEHSQDILMNQHRKH